MGRTNFRKASCVDFELRLTRVAKISGDRGHNPVGDSDAVGVEDDERT